MAQVTLKQVSKVYPGGVEAVVPMDLEIAHGEFAENISVRGLDSSGLNFGGAAVLDRFRFGDVELEVTQIGKKCHGDGCEIFRQVGKCVMPKEGIFTHVINGGRITPGDDWRQEIRRRLRPAAPVDDFRKGPHPAWCWPCCERWLRAFPFP